MVDFREEWRALIDDRAARRFEELCKDIFVFLADHGFAPGELELPPGLPEIVVRFRGKHLAIECLWDDREQHLDLYVERLRDGQPPREFARDTTGRRVREPLVPLLIRHGCRSFRFRKSPKDASLEEQWRIELEDLARLLREHGQDILRDDPTVLDE